MSSSANYSLSVTLSALIDSGIIVSCRLGSNSRYCLIGGLVGGLLESIVGFLLVSIAGRLFRQKHPYILVPTTVSSFRSRYVLQLWVRRLLRVRGRPLLREQRNQCRGHDHGRGLGVPLRRRRGVLQRNVLRGGDDEGPR